LTGTARLSGRASEATIDQLLSIRGSGRTNATSSDHLSGAIDQRANAAIDGDSTTYWSGDILATNPRSIVVSLPAPQTIDHLDLQIVADGHHSVPTQIRVIGEDGTVRVIELPAVADGARRGAVTTLPVRFEPLTTSLLTVELSKLRIENTIDTASGVPVALPPAIAELGIAGVTASAPLPIDTNCRNDLLTVDGRPIAVRITGDVSDAIERKGLTVTSCAGPLMLSKGTHVLVAARGFSTGLDLDRITLSSDVGGTATHLEADGQIAPIVRSPSPNISVNPKNDTETSVEISATSEGFWLVLGQSYSSGWSATLAGHSLGDPILVDGYANGWWIPAGTEAGTITIEWTPQRYIWIALCVTLFAVAVCTILIFWRLRRSEATDTDSAVASIALPFGSRGPSAGWRLSLATAFGVGAAGFILVGPIGAVIGVVVGGVATAWRFGRAVLAICVLALLGGAVANVVLVQYREHRPVRYDWARGYEIEHRLALTGLVLLAADPAVSAVRRRTPRTSPQTPKSEPAAD
jgi:hypothetical protein